jgi:hypothetical protein
LQALDIENGRMDLIIDPIWPEKVDVHINVRGTDFSVDIFVASVFDRARQYQMT